jgi:hypothetical protein
VKLLRGIVVVSTGRKGPGSSIPTSPSQGAEGSGRSPQARAKEGAKTGAAFQVAAKLGVALRGRKAALSPLRMVGG